MATILESRPIRGAGVRLLAATRASIRHKGQGRDRRLVVGFAEGVARGGHDEGRAGMASRARCSPGERAEVLRSVRG